MNTIMEIATREEMEKEAFKRIKILEKMGGIDWVTEWWKQGETSYSEPMLIGSSKVGVVDIFSNNQKLQREKEKFERNMNCVVYYGIVIPTIIGNMISFLFVSNCKSEWDNDRDELKQMIPYVYNKLINQNWGDVTSIKIEMKGGGLVRE